MTPDELIRLQAAMASENQFYVRTHAGMLRKLLVVAGYSEPRIASLTQDDAIVFLTRYARLGLQFMRALGDASVVAAVRDDSVVRIQRENAFLPVDHDTWYEKKV